MQSQNSSSLLYTSLNALDIKLITDTTVQLKNGNQNVTIYPSSNTNVCHR